MIRTTVLTVLLTIGLLTSDDQANAQRRFIELEISTSPRAPLGSQQEWNMLLNDVGADRVRLRTAGSAKVKVVESESSGLSRIKILGAIQDRKLVLPGKSFSARDKAMLREYIQQLRDDGANIALADKKAFGLTSQQLVDLNGQLSKKLELTTKGQTAAEVLQKVRRQLPVDFETDLAAKQALKRSEPILDELEGLSIGTAMAAIMRPLGLVVAPTRERGAKTKLLITDFRKAEEHWPVGWPTQDIPLRSVPDLLEKFPIEVRDFPLGQVIQAIQAKSEVPMLLDHNSIARADIDLSTSQVTLIKKNASYLHALGKVLNQTKPKMKYEIRADENGKSFLWLTTLRAGR